MKHLIDSLRNTLADPLFMRVCMTIYGVLFAGFWSGILWRFWPDPSLGRFVVLILAGFVALGLFMIYTACLTDNATVEKRTSFLADGGGDLIIVVLLLLVIAVALPITAALRSATREENKAL